MGQEMLCEQEGVAMYEYLLEYPSVMLVYILCFALVFLYFFLSSIYMANVLNDGAIMQ